MSATSPAQLLGEATGAARAEVWLRSGEVVRAVACWPDGRCSPESLPLIGAEDLLAERTSLSVPVRQRGELLGALTVETGPGETVRPVELKLAVDLAAQAGHVLGNVRLNEELVRRLEDLQASRQRLVSAQDEERRRLERNLHDGAQQHLVALRVHLGLAEAAIDEGPDQMRALLAESQQVAAEALENLRDLAHGIYPPLLADEGLVVALRTRSRRSPQPVQVHGDELQRYPQEAEMAVYFCCLEALQNAAKYSEASKVEVHLVEGDEALRFGVEDDGKGFDPATVKRGAGLQNMTDRLQALGGDLEIVSSPGMGTRLAGEIPIGPGSRKAEPGPARGSPVLDGDRIG